jgi:hypothetical protein
MNSGSPPDLRQIFLSRFAPKRLKEFEVTVAEDETGIVAFLARRGEEVRLLYTRPDRIGMGAGSQLIEASKATAVGALELWCFQVNERARRFYEARGFHAIRFTDGADNEEQMPIFGIDRNDPPSSQIFLARHCRGYFKGHPGHNAPTKGELLVHGRDDEIRSHEPYGHALYPPKG